MLPSPFTKRAPAGAGRLAALAAVMVSLAIGPLPASAQPAPSAGTAQSPAATAASRALQADLVLWFRNSGHPACTDVRIELLRSVPGLARTHAWVTALDGTTELVSGAMRIGQVDRNSHEVIEWLPKATILADRASVEAAFPKALAPLIVERAQR
jgi:hypothetical protein